MTDEELVLLFIDDDYDDDNDDYDGDDNDYDYDDNSGGWL